MISTWNTICRRFEANDLDKQMYALVNRQRAAIE